MLFTQLLSIYGLLKLNIKSCNAKGEGNENCEKTTIGLISKKTTLHVQHTFLVHFFAAVLHDYTKRRETFWLHVLWRKCRTCSCSLFSLLLIFSSVGASISHFLTAATNSCCSSPYLSLLLSVAFFLVGLCWPVAFFLFFSVFPLSLYSKFVGMPINISSILKTTRILQRFPLPFPSLLTL